MSLAAAELLNSSCWCVGTDLPGLREGIDALLREHGVAASIMQSHPHLFAAVPVFVADSQLLRMREIVRAIHAVAALPAWQADALAGAPATALHAPGNPGSFLGVDFHVDEGEARLIEVNTNPGGALLNVALGRAQQACCAPVAEAFPELQDFAAAEAHLLDLFEAEWRAARGGGRPGRIAIIDEAPAGQYLYPEFLLYARALEARGYAVSIVDPAQLAYDGGVLRADGAPVDLVYNRLTDFALAGPATDALRRAYLDGAVVLTPHPRSHALFANKRNLVHLSDPEWLAGIGLGAAEREALRTGVPQTRLVTPACAEAFWAERKQLFFKPLDGFAGRGAYRGDKLTRRVFAEIAAGGYVAQRIVPPGERVIANDDTLAPLKADVRAYAYEGEVLLWAARLYRGQTTNFRTEGGGFAPVLPAREGMACFEG